MNIPTESEDFERLFEEFVDLLEFTLRSLEKPIPENLPKNLEAKLAALEKDVSSFCQLNEQLIERSKVLGFGRADIKHLTKREKKCIDRSEKLIKEAKDKIKTLPKPNEQAIKSFGTPKERRKHVKRISRKKI